MEIPEDVYKDGGERRAGDRGIYKIIGTRVLGEEQGPKAPLRTQRLKGDRSQ